MSAVLNERTATSLSSLRAPPVEQSYAVVRMGFETLQSFELLQRAAKLLAASTLVPKEYQNNMPNCVIALNMAQRIGADPLMVMQNLYVVHGRPGWSAQFLIATFNQCGRFTAMRFEFFGEKGKDSYGCRAYATEKSTSEKIVGADITLSLARAEGWEGKPGSKWKTMPQQMLMYRSASWLVRAYAPEIAMGLQTTEELRDVYDAESDSNGEYVVKGVADLKVNDHQTIDSDTGEISPADVTPAPSESPAEDKAADVAALYQEALGYAQKGNNMALDLARSLPADMAKEIKAEYKSAYAKK